MKSRQAGVICTAVEAFVDKPCRLTAEDTEALLNELCVKLGYCLAPDDYDAVVANPPTNPQAFAELVMTLDGGGAGDQVMFEPVLEQVLATFEGRRASTS